MAKKKYIQLPKGYISYSQMVLWENDPKRYAEIYFDGRDELRVSNSGMEYGKVIATALEHGADTGEVVADTAMFLLPKYDLADEEIVADMKTKDGWIQLLGRPDTRDSKTCAFREYKTGKGAWTQAKAQKHIQMQFYAMLIYVKFGKILREAYLDWIETVEEEGVIKPTGRVESFKVVFTLSDILNMMARVSRVAKEIEVAYAMHVPNKAYSEF